MEKEKMKKDDKIALGLAILILAIILPFTCKFAIWVAQQHWSVIAIVILVVVLLGIKAHMGK